LSGDLSIIQLTLAISTYLLPFLCLDEMKRFYSNPNKTSFAYFASGEVTLLQSFRKYALGKIKS
jgi:hypothetical protein